MGSVAEYIPCPNCQSDNEEGKCYNDFNYRTGEEHTFCTQCGSVWQNLLVRDADGNIATDIDGKPRYEEWHEINDRIASIKYSGSLGHHMRGLNDNSYNEFLSSFKKELEDNPDNIIEATLTFKQDNKWVTQDLKTIV